MLVTVALLLLTALPTALPAQQIDGRLLEAGSRRPVSGALVELRPVGGDTVLAETMSAEDGAFHLEAATPGRYRIHVERIGYGDWRSGPFSLRTGQTMARTFRVSVRPVDLGTLQVETETECRVRPEEGRQAARLWEEIRTALRLTEVGQRRSLFRFRVRAWTRELGPEAETVREERTWTRTATTLRPFMAMSSELLAEQGFVSGEIGRRQFYAPSARTLVSDAFLDTHCFEVVPGSEAGRPGQIGLRFRPAPDRSVPDVEGTLWVDRESAELRALEYRYVNVEPPAVQERAGGLLSFRRLPTGAWVVDRWHIRMPKLGRQEVRVFDETETRLRLTGLTETGRRVVTVRGEQGELIYDAERATVAGTVWDSTRSRPLEGAVVRLAGTGRADTTGPAGRFRIAGVGGSGAYRLYPDHPRYEALGLAPDTAAVELRPGRVAEQSFAVPSGVRPPRTGTVFGAVVEHRSTEPVSGVRVVLDDGALMQVTDSTGTFRFPEVPAGEHRIAVHHVGYRDWTDTVRVSPGDTAALRLQVSRRVVELEPMEVEVDRPEQARFFGEASRTYALEGPELGKVRKRTSTVAGLVRALDVPGLAVREERIKKDQPGPVGPIWKRRICVEVNRNDARTQGCSMVDVYIDGVQVAKPGIRLRSMDENVIQRVEFVPAVEAGARFGTGSSYGVLLIETRSGAR